ncbi:MAG TPA: pseudouridine synthase [Polyangiaceae bacterium]|nr:pseudouridine synthase [Polyangiaceae bacterium]
MSSPSPCVLFRDSRFVAVDKPSGVVVHRGWADDEAPLLQAVRDRVGQHVFPVHRLDRGASGVVLFALDADAAGAMAKLWSSADCIDKRYLAITRGHPPPHTLLDHPVPREPGGERVGAVTEIWLRETIGRYALVEARPHTGRLHQIRRHLKHLACPLVGDVKYGKGEHNRVWRDAHALHRLALHATSLAFTHPYAGTRVVVDAPLPADFSAALASARAAYGEPGGASSAAPPSA